MTSSIIIHDGDVVDVVLPPATPEHTITLLAGPAGPVAPDGVRWSASTPGILPATSGQHLTTAGGNTLDDGTGKVALTGGTLDAVTVGATTPATSVKTSTLQPSTPVSLTGTMKSWINGISMAYGTLTGGGNLNQLYINDAITGDTGYIWGLRVLDNVYDPAVGMRGAIFGHTLVNSADETNTLAQACYVGVYGRSEGLANLGGSGVTTTGGHTAPDGDSSIGSYWGGWFFGALINGTISAATHQEQVFGVEIDVCAQTGTSVAHKIGLLIVHAGENVGDTPGGVRGIVQDAALQIANQPNNSTWLNGIMFGSNAPDSLDGVSGDWPFDTDSTIMGTCVLGTDGNPANIGVDFTNVTFTDAALKTGAAPIVMAEMASSPTQESGVGKLYVDADGNLHYLGPTTDTIIAFA